MKVLIDQANIQRSLVRITHEILEKNKGTENIVLVGIKTRGEYLAQRIKANIKKFEGVDVDCLGFDIQFWRDDIKNHNLQKPIIDYDFSKKVVILVDDVLFRGRTVRAAMDGVISFGRPKEIQLAILIDRGHRELPIRADYVGKNIPTSLKEVVKVYLNEIDNKEEVVIIEKE